VDLLKWFRRPQVEPVDLPPPAPILIGKPITCTKCGCKVGTFVTLTDGHRYCVKCWSVVSVRRPRS
jgi:hypothetical protein